ncbi:hypothetical protein F4776DRAFT_645656 [Hypoxylon sp. NC0597]|nr:hypothetical protein F4776DRAFT_645656 [Hypoxylon sp. NC0597]
MDSSDIRELVTRRIDEMVDQNIQAGKRIVDPEVLEFTKREAIEKITNALETLQADVRNDLEPIAEAAIAARPNLTPHQASDARFHLGILAVQAEEQAIERLLVHYLGVVNRLILAETWESEDAEEDDDEQEPGEQTNADPNAAEEEQEEEQEEEEEGEEPKDNHSSDDNQEEN